MLVHTFPIHPFGFFNLYYLFLNLQFKLTSKIASLFSKSIVSSFTLSNTCGFLLYPLFLNLFPLSAYFHFLLMCHLPIFPLDLVILPAVLALLAVLGLLALLVLLDYLLILHLVLAFFSTCISSFVVLLLHLLLSSGSSSKLFSCTGVATTVTFFSKFLFLLQIY